MGGIHVVLYCNAVIFHRCVHYLVANSTVAVLSDEPAMHCCLRSSGMYMLPGGDELANLRRFPTIRAAAVPVCCLSDPIRLICTNAVPSAYQYYKLFLSRPMSIL